MYTRSLYVNVHMLVDITDLLFRNSFSILIDTGNPKQKEEHVGVLESWGPFELLCQGRRRPTGGWLADRGCSELED